MRKRYARLKYFSSCCAFGMPEDTDGTFWRILSIRRSIRVGIDVTVDSFIMLLYFFPPLNQLFSLAVSILSSISI